MGLTGRAPAQAAPDSGTHIGKVLFEKFWLQKWF